MARYKLVVEYDGGPFAGFQYQENAPSVQQKIERAVAAFSGEQVRVHAAGRTDAGVHATGQVIHIDLGRETDADTVRDALNHFLRPCPIAIIRAERVGEDFHARFSATGRTYAYRIVNRRAPLTLARGQAWHVVVALDAARMHEAAQALVGRHDFTTFRAARCQARSPVRTLERLDIEAAGEEITIIAESRSFLHHQVRSMVGSLKYVGEGKWTRGDLEAALAARDRRACGPVAPAHGLCLTRVDYGAVVPQQVVPV